VRGAISAVQLLTRIPLGLRPPTRAEIAAAQPWFPVVGLLVGLVLLAIDRLAMRALPDASIDVLLVVALAAITGALHLDGLADAADGLWGGATPARRLEIMRDPHRGSFAVVAVVSALALKWAGLSALPSDVRVEAIVLFPCLARLAMLVCIAAFPYARSDGLGAGMRETSTPALLVGGATALVVAIALLGAGGLAVVAVALAAGLAVGWYATRLLGGVTGDIYGATVEVTEAFTLLFFAAVANRNWIEAWLFS
jgi:adenosylcobinamide-GDP ribazoletransferase